MERSPAVILVVEDEPLIRMDVVDQLEARGYRLLEANSGKQALETIAGADRVDIVFTDVDMPGDVDGLMLASEVDARWPAIGIIVTSGKALAVERPLPNKCRFFPKPYRSDVVHAAIVQILAP